MQTDTILYHHDEPVTLAEKQAAYWVPLIEWVNKEFQVNLKYTNGLFAVKQDQSVVNAFKNVLDKFDNLTLAAFEKAVTQSKSFLIGLALLKKHLTVEEASHLSRLEVLSQIERWGEVEDAHDIDREDMQKHLGCAACVMIKND
ncbi:ATP synthase complex assembly protein atp12 [Clydaea vesicula]|uniref:ATP synthase complex assembly protein atp12 n=1 Tax=Clydaea vesicula TaxID=447962 RepID=A0AAD5XT26_9FUNG|nr:ATP synthase complex assembly protein atp12 [Clydaea vesicula]